MAPIKFYKWINQSHIKFGVSNLQKRRRRKDDASDENSNSYSDDERDYGDANMETSLFHNAKFLEQILNGHFRDDQCFGW